MAMTAQEAKGKIQIERKLAEQGYPTYARIFHEFDLNITEDPGVVAYMVPNKGKIVVNKNLNLDAISVVIRHEILHQYLEHEERLVRHVAKKLKMDPDKLDDLSINKIKQKIYRGKEFNIAGDFEISNLGYTEADKRAIKSMVLNGEVVSGLVTEDHHPDWVDLPLEDMFDKLTGGNQNSNQKSQNSQDGESDNSDGQGSSGSGGMSNQDMKDLNKSLEDGDFDISDGSDDIEDGDGNNTDLGDIDIDKLSDKAKKNLLDKLKEMGPQIGDTGSQEIQDKEESERQKNAIDQGDKESDSKDGKKSGSGSGKKDIDKELSKEIKKAKQKAKSQSSDSSSSADNNGDHSDGGRGNTGGDAQADAGTMPERIKDILSNKSLGKILRGETAKAIDKEKEAKAKRELEKYKKSGIYKFKMSLNNFLKKELDDDRDYTWRKFNKTYAKSNLVKPGRATEDGPVPLINIYFDQSGSWDDSKIAVGEKAMGQIYKYQNEGKLKAKVYYFNNNVFTETQHHGFGGTYGQPIMDHIKQTKPDNVIIMTDSDIDDIRENVTVPGAVWLLFKGGRSQNLIDHIRGKKETVVLDI